MNEWRPSLSFSLSLPLQDDNLNMGIWKLQLQQLATQKMSWHLCDNQKTV